MVKAKVENGENYVKEIGFQFFSPYCEQYKCFGHLKPQCPLVFRCDKSQCVGHIADKYTKVWKPKTDEPQTSSNVKDILEPNAHTNENFAKVPTDEKIQVYDIKENLISLH